MIKAVLFDLDGTLVNSIYDIGGAMNHALESLGQPTFSIEQYYKMVGNGMRTLCSRALAPDKQHLLDTLLERYNAYEKKLKELSAELYGDYFGGLFE